jgi:surface polysaccharide O-acyltransferase-like enzyme
MMRTSKDRHAGADVLRVIAFAGVVCIHAFGAFPENDLMRHVLQDLSRFAVPCFFILAGYFSAREAPVRKLWQRLAWPLLFWLLFYNLRPGLFAGEPAEISLRILYIGWTGGSGYHLWYLTALLVGGALVLTALSQLGWAVTLALTGVLYGIGMALGVYSANLLGTVPPEYWMRSGFFFTPLFFLLGIFLKRFPATFTMRLRYWLGIALVGLLLHMAEKCVLRGTRIIENEYSFGTVFWALGLSAAFLQMQQRSSPILAELAQASFGAYLIHVFILRRMEDHFSVFGPYAQIVLCIVTSLGLAAAYRHLVVKFSAFRKQKSPGKSEA